jgi:hypothetical protein
MRFEAAMACASELAIMRASRESMSCVTSAQYRIVRAECAVCDCYDFIKIMCLVTRQGENGTPSPVVREANFPQCPIAHARTFVLEVCKPPHQAVRREEARARLRGMHFSFASGQASVSNHFFDYQGELHHLSYLHDQAVNDALDDDSFGCGRLIYPP